MSDARLIRDIEDRIASLNLTPDDEAKHRTRIYKALGVEPSGYTSKDLDLPEGSILIGICQGELKQAIARKGALWVDGKAFAAISTAAAEATGRPTMYGWTFWTHAYIPRSGIVLLEELRIGEPRKNSKRS